MNRIYLSKHDDRIVIDDLDPRMGLFLKSINPGFQVVSAPCPGSFIPKYRIARNTWVGIDKEELYEMNQEEVFAAIMASRSDSLVVGDVTLLDLIQHGACKLFEECCLCANKCGVNRFKEPGRCGLGYVAHVCEVLTHIYEEPPCNPAAIINCAGCGMDCVYCIDYEYLNPAKHPALDVKGLQARILKLTGSEKPNSLEFGTGCVESLPWIVTILKSISENINLPVVFNCHLYVPVDVVAVLNKIVDVYLPDFRYFSNACAKRLSGTENYVEVATAALEAMVRSDSKVIVRILVLPGHYECCHKPALQFLSQFRDRIWVSMLGQYVPVRDAHKYQDISRRPTPDELKAVEDLVNKYGLRDVNKTPENFWQGG